MSELGHALGDGTTLPGAVCAVLLLGCVLRPRSHPGAGAAWLYCVLPLLEWCLIPGCQGRGRLVDPPSRASMWRFGFVNPVEFNDDRVDCGGFVRQWRKNRGRCGVCGDPWDEPVPRPHETRGRYGRGTIVRTFTQGQAAVVEAEVTAASTGHFEYRLCPRLSVWDTETHECFKHLLQDDQDRSQIPVSVSHKFARLRHVLRLPQGVSCPACVLQWKFVTMSRAGRAEYRACADVTITPATADMDNATATTATDTAVTTGPATEPLSATTLASSRDNLHASESADYPHATDPSPDTLEELRSSTPAGAPLHNGIVPASDTDGEDDDVDVQSPLYEMQNDDGRPGAQTRVRGEAEGDGGGAEGRGGAAALPATLHYVVTLLGYCAQRQQTPLSTSVVANTLLLGCTVLML
ncbi:uncharacterized protein LOC126997873 [Eriocheir sinensis]|uniref:uncharacterized protein LOC126997873 n=1 Tax=Eriocheir sinensis TaxID=95602 RepID=UPI0021C5A85E|nr:uncharacterized protein LOC126997873 [Eriocheir sinensis]